MVQHHEAVTFWKLASRAKARVQISPTFADHAMGRAACLCISRGSGARDAVEPEGPLEPPIRFLLFVQYAAGRAGQECFEGPGRAELLGPERIPQTGQGGEVLGSNIPSTPVLSVLTGYRPLCHGYSSAWPGTTLTDNP